MNITFLADYTTQYACKVGKRKSSVCIITDNAWLLCWLAFEAFWFSLIQSHIGYIWYLKFYSIPLSPLTNLAQSPFAKSDRADLLAHNPAVCAFKCCNPLFLSTDVI